MQARPAIRRHLILCAAVFLGACARPLRVMTFSRGEPDTTSKLKRVVIASPQIKKENSPSPFKSTWVALSEQLQAQGIPSIVVEQDPLELERGQAIRNRASAFGATHLLSLSVASSSITVRGNTTQEGATMWEASVLELDRKKTVWRGITHVYYGHSNNTEQAERVSISIISKLRGDGLL